MVRQTRTRIATLFAAFASLTACSNDVPQLAKLSSNATILAFGDSLTYGSGARQAESYPAVLAGLTGRKVINAGIPGEISARGLSRLPGLLERYDPEVLILCHGGNDFLQRKDIDYTVDNLGEMIRITRQRDIAVLLLGVPKPGLILRSPEFYGQVATEYAIPFDGRTLPEILSEAALKSDPVHPNAKGYRHLAERLLQLLKETGAI